MCDQVLPIGEDVIDTKLFSNCFGALASTTGDGDDFRAHAIAKARDLRGAGKPRPDNSDSNRYSLHGVLLYRISQFWQSEWRAREAGGSITSGCRPLRGLGVLYL